MSSGWSGDALDYDNDNDGGCLGALGLEDDSVTRNSMSTNTDTSTRQEEANKSTLGVRRHHAATKSPNFNSKNSNQIILHSSISSSSISTTPKRRRRRRLEDTCDSLILFSASSNTDNKSSSPQKMDIIPYQASGSLSKRAESDTRNTAREKPNKSTRKRKQSPQRKPSTSTSTERLKIHVHQQEPKQQIPAMVTRSCILRQKLMAQQQPRRVIRFTEENGKKINKVIFRRNRFDPPKLKRNTEHKKLITGDSIGQISTSSRINSSEPESYEDSGGQLGGLDLMNHQIVVKRAQVPVGGKVEDRKSRRKLLFSAQDIAIRRKKKIGKKRDGNVRSRVKIKKRKGLKVGRKDHVKKRLKTNPSSDDTSIKDCLKVNSCDEGVEGLEASHEIVLQHDKGERAPDFQQNDTKGTSHQIYMEYEKDVRHISNAMKPINKSLTGYQAFVERTHDIDLGSGEGNEEEVPPVQNKNCSLQQVESSQCENSIRKSSFQIHTPDLSEDSCDSILIPGNPSDKECTGTGKEASVLEDGSTAKKTRRSKNTSIVNHDGLVSRAKRRSNSARAPRCKGLPLARRRIAKISSDTNEQQEQYSEYDEEKVTIENRGKIYNIIDTQMKMWEDLKLRLQASEGHFSLKHEDVEKLFGAPMFVDILSTSTPASGREDDYYNCEEDNKITISSRCKERDEAISNTNESRDNRIKKMDKSSLCPLSATFISSKENMILNGRQDDTESICNKVHSESFNDDVQLTDLNKGLYLQEDNADLHDVMSVSSDSAASLFDELLCPEN